MRVSGQYKRTALVTKGAYLNETRRGESCVIVVKTPVTFVYRNSVTVRSLATISAIREVPRLFCQTGHGLTVSGGGATEVNACFPRPHL